MNSPLIRILGPLYFSLLPFVCGAVLLLAAPLRLIRRLFRRRPNSLWAGTPILTLPLKARAERMLGVNARSLVYSSYGIAQQGFDIHLGRWVRFPLLGWPVPLAIFCWACLTQDRLHFFCDQALLPSRNRRLHRYELAVYRCLGIQVFFWVYGGDVRTRRETLALGEPNCCTDCQAVGSACICDADPARRNLEAIKRFATAVFSMGDMIHYTPGSVNDLFFWPIDLAAEGGGKYRPVYPVVGPGETVKLVHAANHRHFKGTSHLVAAVERLKRKGWPIELQLVEKRPNAEALDLYRSADIIFDQCLIGFHGYFALEAMALGKPVLCFIRNPGRYLLCPETCPIVNVHRDSIESVLQSLLEKPEQLFNIGVNGRGYIEQHYSLEAFSARLAAAYERMGVSL